MGVYENGPAHIFGQNVNLNSSWRAIWQYVSNVLSALVISVEKTIRYLHKWFCIVIAIMVLFA